MKILNELLKYFLEEFSKETPAGIRMKVPKEILNQILDECSLNEFLKKLQEQYSNESFEKQLNDSCKEIPRESLKKFQMEFLEEFPKEGPEGITYALSKTKNPRESLAEVSKQLRQ